MINGKLNRVSEGNLDLILGELRDIYQLNPRSEVNKVICECIEQLCCSDVQVMLPLISVCSALIAGLFNTIGTEIGGYALELYVTKMVQAINDNRQTGQRATADDDAAEVSKRSINFLLLIIFMYNFGVVQCVLIYDIFRMLVEGFSELEIEMLLALLRNSGKQLRSDDTSALQDMIVMIQERAKTSSMVSSR